MRLSIVIPIHNEAGAIDELHQRVLRVAMTSPLVSEFELIFVDDGSTDGSGALLNSLAFQHPGTCLLKHERRRGQAAALRTGFQHAQFEYCLTMDGDLQVAPEDIPLLLASAEHQDVVNARRIARRDRSIVLLSSKAYNFIMRCLFGSPCADCGSNFTLFRTHLVKGIPIGANDHRYLIPLTMRKGASRITEVDIRHAERRSGRSKYSLFKALPAAIELVAFCCRLHSGVYD